MTITQLIAVVSISILPVFAFIAVKDGIRSMFRVLLMTIAVCAWCTIVALGVMKLVP